MRCFVFGYSRCYSGGNSLLVIVCCNGGDSWLVVVCDFKYV